MEKHSHTRGCLVGEGVGKGLGFNKSECYKERTVLCDFFRMVVTVIFVGNANRL